jgi:hypothetical protein
MKNLKVAFLPLIFVAIFNGCEDSLEITSSEDSDEVVPQESSVSELSSGSLTESLSESHSSSETILNLSSETGTTIELSDSGIVITGSGAISSGNTVTIKSGGVYRVSGELSDGNIIVSIDDESKAVLILDGVSISSLSTAPIYIENSGETVIDLASGTKNYLYDSTAEREEDSVIYSKDNLTISGSGYLNIVANYNDGIKSKDGLLISSGDIAITSVDDGIIGKDYISITGGNFLLNVGGDGLKSTNEDTTENIGYISITGGTFTINSENDAIQSEGDTVIDDGVFTIVSGNGSSSSSGNSAKGLKSNGDIAINGGVFSIDSADDSINADSEIAINGGTFELASGDDGIRADFSFQIDNGYINISKSYEGIESRLAMFNGGEVHIKASDDGINMVNTEDTSSVALQNLGNRPEPGDRPDFGQIGGMMSESGDYYLYINGGSIYVDADGDGLDSNGYIEMSGGYVFVNGPTANNNGALDFDYTFNITGGTLIAVGSSGMAHSPSSSSTQKYTLLKLNSTINSGSLVAISDLNGESVDSFLPSKDFQSVVYSSPDLVTGSYNLSINGELYTTFEIE